MGEPIRGHGSCVLNLTAHWLFRVGAEPHFSRLERFPIYYCVVNAFRLEPTHQSYNVETHLLTQDTGAMQ